MKFNSPLRYPGGKGKTADFFAELFRSNNLVGGTYVEPYVGGGSVALHLLFEGLVDKIVINDKDRSLYAFWYSALYFTDELCHLIKETPITVDNWRIQKEIQSSKEDVDLLTLGFSTFYLNRTNRSGIIKGGIIGGINQMGNYGIDARYNKENLIKRIQKIAQYTNQIKLFNLDAVQLVKEQKQILPTNTLFYFDPPYYVKGKGLYMNYYCDNDHRDIRDEITLIDNQKWIVTYDYVPFIAKLYENYRMIQFSLNYSASTVGKGKEYMIFSNNINIPVHPLFLEK